MSSSLDAWIDCTHDRWDSQGQIPRLFYLLEGDGCRRMLSEEVEKYPTSQ